MIEINEKNQLIISNILADILSVIKELSILEKDLENEGKRLIFIDLLYRIFPNINTVNILLQTHFKENFKTNPTSLS